jgi:hypothetical protein
LVQRKTYQGISGAFEPCAIPAKTWSSRIKPVQVFIRIPNRGLVGHFWMEINNSGRFTPTKRLKG